MSPARRDLEEKRERLRALLKKKAGVAAGPFPLSVGQQALAYIQDLAPESSAYHVVFCARCREPLDGERLRRALEELLQRHAALRTTLLGRSCGERRQEVGAAPAVELIGAEDLVEENLEEALGQHLGQHLGQRLRQPFDLAAEAPIRWSILRRGPADHILFLLFHHIAIDFWSLGLLLEELDLLLKEQPLPALGASYRRFVSHQRDALAGSVGERLRRYWRQRLADLPPALDLPTDRPRPKERSFEGATALLRFEAAETEAARKLARESGATLFATLLAVLQILLRRWSGQRDLLVATPVANRDGGFEKTVGYFVHQVAIRGDRGLEAPFAEVVEQVRDRSLEAVEHCALPFAELVNLLDLPRNPSRAPLCDVGFALETPRMDRRGIFSLLLGDVGASVELGGKAWEAVDLPQQEGQLDLNLHLLEGEGGLGGLVAYDTALFDGSTVERLLSQLRRLLSGIAARPHLPVGDQPLLGRVEEQQLLALGTGAEASRAEGSMVDAVLERCRRQPEEVAVEDCAGSMTYGALEARSERLARRLRALGVGPEVPVAVLEEPCPQMVVAWLAILRCGGVYLPLDPQNPPARLREMLGPQTMDSTSGAPCRILVSRREILQAVFAEKGILAGLDILDPEEDAGSEVARAAAATTRPSPIHPLQLVNLIFTSGSTGRPKGVAIPHRALHNVVTWYGNLLNLGPRDRVPNTLRPGFDPAGLEVWSTLLAGATLVVPEAEDRASGQRFARWLARQRITAATVPAPLGESLLAAQLPDDLRLRHLVLGGEALRRRPGADLTFEVHNHYGPTEATIVACGGPVAVASEQTVPDVGRPVDGVSILLLDDRLQPKPRGGVGEVFIRGVGVARGYLGRPALTAAAFLPDPSGSEKGGRIYRSGDLGRWGKDGNLQLLGRKDEQIKIRGFRVELEEVERALCTLPEVAAGVVVPQGAGSNRAILVAYVVPGDSRKKPDRELLGATLAQHLPEYMVPTRWVFLEALPLTANGKVDRRALAVRRISGPSTVAVAASEAERRIARIWGQVLGLKIVPPEANFFDLGGNSLLLGETLSPLEESLGHSLTLVELLRYPTVRSLAHHLEGPATPEDSRSEGISPELFKAEPIAVIGMAGRFPGAASIRELWDLLRDGREGLRSFSEDELAAAGAPARALRDDRFVAAGGILQDIEEFDAPFFGLNPREAEILDPQQRIFLECAWQALEDAGYVPGGEDRTGVFAGSGQSTYLRHHLEGHDELSRSVGDYQLTISNDKDFLAPRVAYRLDLKGPAVNVQTACSTSLVAVHLACQSLRAGECEMALAGGVTLRLPQTSGYRYQEGMILSPDGHCRPFSEGAAGTVGGNGVGVVLLKPLSRALADGDPIHGVIPGSAINNDGSLKAGFTAPNVGGQAAVIRRALAAAGAQASEIDYIEAHGTATELGDPIEVAALNRVLQGVSGPVGLGSVKSNLGHLDTAAGVTGLIKTLLALEHEEIPRTLHYESPNPRIDFGEGPLEVVAQNRPWPRREGRARRAGVSSFGIGGTNAHVIVEEAPTRAPAAVPGSAPAAGPERPAELWVLSGRTPRALDQVREDLGGYLSEHPSTSHRAVAHTLQAGRRAFEARAAVVLRPDEDGGTVLADAGRGHRGTARNPAAPRIYLFPGQGAQYPSMGRELYEGFEVYRRHLDRCAEILEPRLGLDLRHWLHRDVADEEAAARLRHTDLAQPALFAVASSLVELWRSLGVEATAMIGHSIGEWVAAWESGVLDLESALTLVAARGRLIHALPPGEMVSVALGEEELRSLIRPFLREGISLAAVNGPRQGVVSGSAPAMAGLVEALQREGVEHRRLHTSHAFHSGMMDPCLEAFRDEVRKVALKAPQRPFVSNVTGRWIRDEEATDAEYWVGQLRSTVRFSDALASAAAQYEEATFLECGPGRSLASFVRSTLPGARAVSCLPHPKSGAGARETFLEAIGRLWLEGQEIRWQGLDPTPPARLSLPTYPFQRERYWIDPPEAIAPGRPRSPAPRKAQRGPAFYRPFFKTAPPAHLADEQDGTRWLLLSDGGSLGDEVAAILRREGNEVLRVVPGSRFRQVSAQEAELRPGSREDVLQLLAAFGTLAPERILHLFLMDPGYGSLPLPERLEAGFFSLQALLRGYQETGRISELRSLDAVLPVAADALLGEGLDPAAAMVEALLGTVGQEVPTLRCRALRWVPREDAGAASALRRELGAVASRQSVLLARGQRYLAGWENIELSVPKAQEVLKPGGTYLLTGGFGGIALKLAERLVGQVRARLVLVSRRPLPPEPAPDDPLAQVRECIERWRAGGSEVMTAAADVTDRAALAAVVRAARRRFGRLDGVLHCAGLAGGGLLETRDRESSGEVFAPKVSGTEALAEALRDDPPDFLVLFSSLASAIPLPGQGEYAAANAFLDAFAEGSVLPGTVSVQWDFWQGRGMAAEPLPAGFESWRQGPGLTAQEGWDCLLAALGSGLRRLAVASFDLVAGGAETPPQLPERPVTQPSAGFSGQHSRPDLSTSWAAPRSSTEEALVEIWSALLGIEAVGIHDDFFELGGHSLLGTRVLSRIEDSFGVHLPLAKLFQLPTVAALAAELDAQRSRPGPVAEESAPVDDAVDLDPEALSDEAVAHLLAALAPEEVGV